MSKLFYYCFIFLIQSLSLTAVNIVGQCNSSNDPPSWLMTSGHGLDDWATAGVPANKGQTFCFNGDKGKEQFEVMYHINISDVSKMMDLEEELLQIDASNLTNACLNQDPRIHYCIPFCGNDDLQLAMITAALMSNGSPHTAVLGTVSNFQNVSADNWAFTVIKVNLTANPEAHLVVQSFLDPAWCSVYVGMQTFGDPYLYEMQGGIVLR